MRFVARAPSDDENVNISKTHPVKEAVVLTVGLLGAGIVLLTALTFATDVVTGFIPPSVEVATFGNAFDVEVDATAETDGRLAAVRAVLDPLLELDPELGYDVRPGILEQPAPNAFAMLGGGLYVTSGLLEQVESENELAFVLAHELGHFAHRDPIRGMSRGLVVTLVSGAVFGSTFSGTGEELFGAVHKSEEGKHSRAQESEADAYALELLAKRYDHVAGSTFFFERLAEGELEGSAGRFASYFSTHPMSADRVAALRAHAKSSGFAIEGELLPADQRFKRSAPSADSDSALATSVAPLPAEPSAAAPAASPSAD